MTAPDMLSVPCTSDLEDSVGSIVQVPIVAAAHGLVVHRCLGTLMRNIETGEKFYDSCDGYVVAQASSGIAAAGAPHGMCLLTEAAARRALELLAPLTDWTVDPTVIPTVPNLRGRVVAAVTQAERECHEYAPLPATCPECGGFKGTPNRLCELPHGNATPKELLAAVCAEHGHLQGNAQCLRCHAPLIKAVAHA